MLIKLSLKYLLLLLAASVIIFICLEILPGDIAQIILGNNADASSIEQLRQQLGLNQPLLQRYWSWIANFASFDLGTSYIYKTSVTQLITERLAITLPITIISLLISIFLAVSCAVISCLNSGKISDKIFILFSQLGIAIANFWLAFLLILFFAVWLRWLPSGGFAGWSNDFTASCRALVLPITALSLFLTALLTRNIRSHLLALIGEDFTRTAQAKGLAPRYILTRHLLINTVAPTVTLVGLQFASLISGAIVIEQIFSLPGVGQLLLSAIANRDIELLRSCLLVLVALVIIINLITNYLHHLFDPRLTN